MINKELLTSPECCSRGPLLLVGFESFLQNLEINTIGRFTEKLWWIAEAKILNWSHRTQKSTIFECFWRIYPKNYVLHFFLNPQKYIDPSGHFFYHEILCSSIFFVELHLDDVLEVHLVVWFKLLFLKLVDKYNRKINRKMFNLWNKR